MSKFFAGLISIFFLAYTAGCKEKTPLEKIAEGIAEANQNAPQPEWPKLIATFRGHGDKEIAGPFVVDDDWEFRLGLRHGPRRVYLVRQNEQGPVIRNKARFIEDDGRIYTLSGNEDGRTDLIELKDMMSFGPTIDVIRSKGGRFIVEFEDLEGPWKVEIWQNSNRID